MAWKKYASDGSPVETVGPAYTATHAVTFLVTDPGGSALAVGDGQFYWRVPSTLNGMDLIAVAGKVITASSGGTLITVQIHNLTQAADMLTTRLTIDNGETDSLTAATAAVIDTANDDVATGDTIRVDVDQCGSGAKGLIIELQFRAP